MVTQIISTHLRQKWTKRSRSLLKRDHLRRHLRSTLFLSLSRARAHVTFFFINRKKRNVTLFISLLISLFLDFATPLSIFLYTLIYLSCFYFYLSFFFAIHLFSLSSLSSKATRRTQEKTETINLPTMCRPLFYSLPSLSSSSLLSQSSSTRLRLSSLSLSLSSSLPFVFFRD